MKTVVWSKDRAIKAGINIKNVPKELIRHIFLPEYLFGRNKSINFVTIEPTAPLNDAKLVGHFFYSTAHEESI